MTCELHPGTEPSACEQCGQLTCQFCPCTGCRTRFADVPPLRVGSWNIKTLGKQFHHNEQAVAKLLAAVMLRMNADVICLMEVMEGFGSKHAVSIVEEMKKMSDTMWLVAFPGTYTGAGGRNGLESYAVVYNSEIFDLTRFTLVGQEFGYSKKHGRRYRDDTSPVMTRRPAQAVFRVRPICTHFPFYPEFRVLIFHAPSVAPKDYQLACDAIEALGSLPAFADASSHPYTILCADFNIDEEAANHVRPRDVQQFDDIIPKSKEQSKRDVAAYNLAFDQCSEAEDACDTHLDELAKWVEAGDPTAQYLQIWLESEKARAELAAAQKSESRTLARERRLSKAEQELGDLLQRLQASSQMNTISSDKFNAFKHKLSELNKAKDEAENALDLAAETAIADLPSDEEQVLEATEKAFAPITETDMLADLRYEDNFRTTLRMSIHSACIRDHRAPHYNRKLSFENFVYSNYDQVLVRTGENYAWNKPRVHVINLLSAILPTPVRDRLHIDTTNPSADTSLVQYDYEPIENSILGPFLSEPNVLAHALVTAFKRFVDMNNSDPNIDAVRREALASASTQSPIADFFAKKQLWDKMYRKAVRYILPDEMMRLFEINVYLSLANVLSDHIPVIVQIKIVRGKVRPNIEPAAPRFPSISGLPAVWPIQGCPTATTTAPCKNLANCCGCCDERTSLKTLDGCLTGYQLVRAAAQVCMEFISRYPHQWGYGLLCNTHQQIVGGGHWTAMAGHLLFVKKRSAAFAVDNKTEYFFKNRVITVGLDRVPIQSELCSTRNELAARKHPRILFADGHSVLSASQSQPQTVGNNDNDDDIDVQEEDENANADKRDWSYPKIAENFSVYDPAWFAQTSLDFLRTGNCPVQDAGLKRALAALLVTIFGVEANKDNSTYLTGILIFLGISTRRYTISEAFARADLTNECNLAGSLGLFPLASSDRANLYGKRRCLTGRATDSEADWSEAAMMNAMLNRQPRSRDSIILKKEMVLLVDVVREHYKDAGLYPTAKLLEKVRQYWMDLLYHFYGQPPLLAPTATPFHPLVQQLPNTLYIKLEMLREFLAQNVVTFVNHVINNVPHLPSESLLPIVYAGIDAAIARGFITPDGISQFVRRLFYLGTAYYEHPAVRDWMFELRLSEARRLEIVDLHANEIRSWSGLDL